MPNVKTVARHAYSFRHIALRALIFGLIWYLLPAWLFFLAALYLYFVPFFQWTKFLPSFIAILLIYLLAPATLGYAFAGAVLFGWLLAIRDLLFIDRQATYEALIFATVFFIFRLFYMAGTVPGSGVFLGALFISGLVGWMIRALMNLDGSEGEKLRSVSAWLSVWLTWEILMVCLLFPVDFVYQSVIAFLLIVPIVDLLPPHFQKERFKERVFVAASMVFCGLVLILAAAPLGL